MLAKPAKDRFFEDYVAGAVYDFGAVTVDEAAIVAFGTEYDPQYLHIDPERAASGPYGGLIASGWQTLAIAMRLFVDNFLPDGASMGSPGVDELRWLVPVRPGDVLHIRVAVLATRVSRSKPDRGIVETRVETLNQRDEVVATMQAVNFMRRR